MATVPTNPGMEEIRRSVDDSYKELIQLIDGPLATLEPEKLYESPAENEWTIMENLAHILEFMPYWANQIRNLVDDPGRGFGRIPTHDGRVEGIRRHKKDKLKDMRAALPRSYEQLKNVLSSLQDSDLEIKGQHVQFGEKDMKESIKEYVTKHLSDHVTQIKVCLKILGSQLADE